MNILNMLSKSALPMDKFSAYGPEHILILIIGLSSAFILAFAFRNLDDRKSDILLFSIGIFLLFGELYKQLFYTYYIGHGTYQWWIFPFQLCSVPMYLLILVPVIKSKTIKSGMINFMATYNFIGGFLALFEPSGLIHEFVGLTVHAFLWHIILVFIGAYLIISNRALRETHAYRDATMTFLSLALIAFCFNVIFAHKANGPVNLFFIGPATNTIFILRPIAENYGWYVSTAIYLPAVCIIGLIIYELVKVLRKKLQID